MTSSNIYQPVVSNLRFIPPNPDVQFGFRFRSLKTLVRQESPLRWKILQSYIRQSLPPPFRCAVYSPISERTNFGRIYGVPICFRLYLTVTYGGFQAPKSDVLHRQYVKNEGQIPLTFLKFIHSEKTTKFYEISTENLSYFAKFYDLRVEELFRIYFNLNSC